MQVAPRSNVGKRRARWGKRQWRRGLAPRIKAGRWLRVHRLARPLTKRNVADVVARERARVLQLGWRVLVAEDHLRCLLVAASALLELLQPRTSGGGTRW